MFSLKVNIAFASALLLCFVPLVLAVNSVINMTHARLTVYKTNELQILASVPKPARKCLSNPFLNAACADLTEENWQKATLIMTCCTLDRMELSEQPLRAYLPKCCLDAQTTDMPLDEAKKCAENFYGVGVPLPTMSMKWTAIEMNMHDYCKIDRMEVMFEQMAAVGELFAATVQAMEAKLESFQTDLKDEVRSFQNGVKDEVRSVVHAVTANNTAVVNTAINEFKTSSALLDKERDITQAATLARIETHVAFLAWSDLHYMDVIVYSYVVSIVCIVLMHKFVGWRQNSETAYLFVLVAVTLNLMCYQLPHMVPTVATVLHEGQAECMVPNLSFKLYAAILVSMDLLSMLLVMFTLVFHRASAISSAVGMTDKEFADKFDPMFKLNMNSYSFDSDNFRRDVDLAMTRNIVATGSYVAGLHAIVRYVFKNTVGGFAIPETYMWTLTPQETKQADTRIVSLDDDETDNRAEEEDEGKSGDRMDIPSFDPDSVHPCNKTSGC